MERHPARNPLFAGGLFALFAAVAFGVTTPFIKRFGAHVGPFATAGVLYAGAAAASLAMRARGEAQLRRAHIGRLVVVALLGAVAAPVCLAWGLGRTDAVVASLLLNFEAVFTVLLARMLFREPIGARPAVAIACMVAGGATLVGGGRGLVEGAPGWGAVAVLAASLAWAADNTLTRPLADLEPSHVVLGKASIGATVSLAVAALLRERPPGWVDAIALAGCGALGYGASLHLYLMAQRRIGAARTASVFAVAPFIGAAVAWAMGDGDPDRAWVTLGAGALFAVAVYLHLTERHGHAHEHDVLEHEHAHRHDDGHHDAHHDHDALARGEHTHAHRHEPRVHAHPHGPDLHHRHRH